MGFCLAQYIKICNSSAQCNKIGYSSPQCIKKGYSSAHCMKTGSGLNFGTVTLFREENLNWFFLVGPHMRRIFTAWTNYDACGYIYLLRILL